MSYLYLNKSDKICKSLNFFLISLSSYFSLVMCKIDDNEYNGTVCQMSACYASGVWLHISQYMFLVISKDQ